MPGSKKGARYHPYGRKILDSLADADLIELTKDATGEPVLIRAGKLKDLFQSDAASNNPCAIKPTKVSDPSAGLSANKSGNYERGTTLTNLILTASYFAGLILDGDNAETHPLKGNPNNYEFSGVGISPNINQAGNQYTLPSFEVIFGKNKWCVDVSYDEGTEEYHNSCQQPSNHLDALRGAGDIDACVSPITGRWRVFWDVGMTLPTNSAGVRAMNSQLLLNNTYPLQTGTTERRFYIAFPAVFDLLKIEDEDALFQDVAAKYDFIQNIDVEDAGGTLHTYKLYAMTNAIAYLTDHLHRIYLEPNSSSGIGVNTIGSTFIVQ